MERGTREAPPQEYGVEQLKEDTCKELGQRLRILKRLIASRDEEDEELFRIGLEHVQFKRRNNDKVGADEEIRNGAEALVERELNSEGMRQEKAAIERLLARFSKK